MMYEYVGVAAGAIVSAASVSIMTAIWRKITGFFTKFDERLDKLEEQQEMSNAAHLDEIRSEIVRVYHLAVTHGYITESELHSVMSLYEMYKKLGGNGYVDAIIEKIKEMKVKVI